jgi:hypothetical protein
MHFLAGCFRLQVLLLSQVSPCYSLSLHLAPLAGTRVVPDPSI